MRKNLKEKFLEKIRRNFFHPKQKTQVKKLLHPKTKKDSGKKSFVKKVA